METVTLSNGILTVRIAALGAEIVSIRDASGVERLWQGRPGAWSKHAPVLFPIAGGLKEDTYLLDGKAYSLPKHGFARNRLFAVEAFSGDEATFLLAGPAAAHEGYPFEYTLRLCYTLSGNALTARSIVENVGEKPLWYSAGGHEAYACPGGIGQYQIVFDQAETLAHHWVGGSLLTGETVPVDTIVPMEGGGRVLPIRDALFANDTLVLASLKSRGVTLQSRLHPRRVRVDFPDFDHLLIWTQVGEEYVCIEPWHNLPDSADSDQDITQKPGMIQVMPGGSSTLTHVLTFE